MQDFALPIGKRRLLLAFSLPRSRSQRQTSVQRGELALHALRAIAESLFLSGVVRVLVATATLAWGLNLPARLVIIKVRLLR